MMAKIYQPSNKRSSRSNKPKYSIPANHLERIIIFERGMNERRAEELGNSFIAYVIDNPKCLYRSEFLAKEGILETTWCDWEKEYESLKRSSSYAKIIFAHRREQLAIEKDPKFLSNSMHLYTKIFEDDKTLEHERKKELKNIDVKKNDLPSIIAAINATMAPLDIDQKKQLPSEKDNDEG